MNYIFLLFGVTFLFILVYYLFRRVSSTQKKKKNWVLLFKVKNRNQAYIIKSLLDNKGVNCVVEDEITMGVLYNLDNTTQYPIYIPTKKLSAAKAVLENSDLYFEQKSNES